MVNTNANARSDEMQLDGQVSAITQLEETGKVFRMRIR